MTSATGTTAILLWLALNPLGCAPESGQRPAVREDSVLARGKVVYKEQRCRVCHSIADDGNRRYPLDEVGGRLTEVQIRKWIVAPREMDAKVQKPSYDQLPKGDLDALITYLTSLQATSKDSAPGPRP